MDKLKVVEQKIVGFDGAEIMGVKTSDGKIRVGVRWVCEGIGLTTDQAKRQVKNLRTDVVLSKLVSNLTLDTGYGFKDVLCIELDALPLWLAKISITPTMQAENQELVERLVDYQLRAKDVLAEAFIGKQQPKTQAELIAMLAQDNVEKERRLTQVELQVIETKKEIKETKKKQDNITEILSLNPTEWRKKVNSMINKIANVLGGFQAFQDVRNESYQLLEERAKCNLSTRLTNKKQKMALEGVAKSRIDKVNKMDVIADDARLTEIYLAIVKEMAVRYHIDLKNIS